MRYALLLLLNMNNEVLLLKRCNTIFGNKQYSMPGGKVEANETAKQAIIREAFEELNIKIKPENLEFVHLLFRKDSDNIIFDAGCFKAIKWDGHLKNQELEKCSKIKWFNLNNLPENILPAHKQIIELVQKNTYYSEHGFAD